MKSNTNLFQRKTLQNNIYHLEFRSQDAGRKAQDPGACALRILPQDESSQASLRGFYGHTAQPVPYHPGHHPAW